MRIVWAGALCAYLTVAPVGLADTPVDEALVLRMMRAVPAVETGADLAPGYPWDRVGHARAVARAVAASAPTRQEAADLVVWGIFESALRADARGDDGRSLGVWQLSTLAAPPEVALDPMRAAPVWLELAAASRRACASSPPELQLAALAGGTCQRALSKVALRERIALRVLRAVE
jgi:hypothetical protein